MMWLYKNWRTALTLGLVVVGSVTMIAVLAFFPPALPFMAGLVAWAVPMLALPIMTMAAPAAIAIITAFTAASIAITTLLFHGASDYLCKKVKDAVIVFYLDEYKEEKHFNVDIKKPSYRFPGFCLASLVCGFIGAAVVGVPLILMGGWVPSLALVVGSLVGTAASFVFHAAFFSSVALDNVCIKKAAILEANILPPYEVLKLGLKTEPSSCATMCKKFSEAFKSHRKPTPASAAETPGTSDDEADDVSIHKGRAAGWRSTESKWSMAKLCSFLSGKPKKLEILSDSVDDQSECSVLLP